MEYTPDQQEDAFSLSTVYQHWSVSWKTLGPKCQSGATLAPYTNVCTMINFKWLS